MLDRNFPFAPLILAHNVLPPVIQTGRDTVRQHHDAQLQFADAVTRSSARPGSPSPHRTGGPTCTCAPRARPRPTRRCCPTAPRRRRSPIGSVPSRTAGHEVSNRPIRP